MKYVMREAQEDGQTKVWFGLKCSCGEYFNSGLRCRLHEAKHVIENVVAKVQDGEQQ